MKRLFELLIILTILFIGFYFISDPLISLAKTIQKIEKKTKDRYQMYEKYRVIYQ